MSRLLVTAGGEDEQPRTPTDRGNWKHFRVNYFWRQNVENATAPQNKNQRKVTRTVALALLGLDDDCRPMTHTSGHSIRARIVIGAFYHLCSFVDSRLWTAQRGFVATSNRTYGHLLLMSKQENRQSRKDNPDVDR